MHGPPIDDIHEAFVRYGGVLPLAFEERPHQRCAISLFEQVQNHTPNRAADAHLFNLVRMVTPVRVVAVLKDVLVDANTGPLPNIMLVWGDESPG